MLCFGMHVFTIKSSFMRLIYVAIFLLTLISFAEAQQFSDDGKIKGPFEKIVLRNATFTPAPPITQVLSTEAKNEIRKKLHQKFQQTIDNLTESGLDSFYIVLWGQPAYDILLAEAIALRDFLKPAGPIPAIGFTYFPSHTEINNMLNTTPLFALAPPPIYNEHKQQWELKLIYTDPLKNWILTKYNTDLATSGLRNFEQTAEYRRHWEVLNKNIRDIPAKIKFLESLPMYKCSNGATPDYDPVLKFLNDTLRENPVFKIFREDKMHKSWLWFTNGIFHVNPFGFTSADKEWILESVDSVSMERYDSVIKRMIDSMAKCCDADAKKIEALLRAKKGKELFLTINRYNDPILGINNLTEIEESKRIRNHILLPVTQNKKDSAIYIMHFNATDEYALRNKIPKAVSEKEKVMVAVHNIPASTKVDIVDSKTVGVDKSSGELHVEGVVKDIGAAIGLLKPVAGIIPGFFGAKPNIPQNPTIDPVNVDAATKNTFNGMPEITLYMQSSTGFDTVTTINRRNIKDSIILDYVEKLKSQNDTLAKLLEDSLIQYILDICLIQSIPLTADSATLRFLSNKLINDFTRIANNNLNRRNTIEQLLVDLHNDALAIAAILKLSDRSLPPAALTEKTNKNPVFRTQILEPDLSEPPAVNKFQIKETKPKAGGGDTTAVVAKKEVRSGKLFLLQLSAGIGFTFSDFNAKLATANGTEIDVKTQDDQVRMVAGLHIYPWKLFKQDDSFLALNNGRWRNRLYVFTGLGIPDPLKNYYLGLGADLIPGFKLTIGVHFFRHYKYKLSNNQIVEENSAVKAAGPFVSFGIDPGTFAKALGFF